MGWCWNSPATIAWTPGREFSQARSCGPRWPSRGRSLSWPRMAGGRRAILPVRLIEEVVAAPRVRRRSTRVGWIGGVAGMWEEGSDAAIDFVDAAGAFFRSEIEFLRLGGARR